MYRDERLVACGELWADDGEAEVELARLIVDPGERGQGLGQHLVTEWNACQPVGYLWLSLIT